jgi:UDP:flavonoid glycosyltransferase YjiC (YdhE family)
MSTVDPEDTTDLMMKALELSGQRGVLLGGWGGIGPGILPDYAYRIEAIPHTWLFPQMKAVVHHGGVGTTGVGLWAGVPAITIPFIADQPFWGNRVYELGVGTKPLDRKSLTAEQLADAIKAALTDEAMQARTRELGARIRAEQGVKRAVEIFERHFSNL